MSQNPGGVIMIFITDDQLNTKSIKEMENIFIEYNSSDSLQFVDYLDKGHFKRPAYEVAKELHANIILRMFNILPRDTKKVLPFCKNIKDIVKIPEEGLVQIINAYTQYVAQSMQNKMLLNRRDIRFAFIVDLAADGSSNTPDTSYGINVIRELAILLKPNNENNLKEKIKYALKEFYGDQNYITIFHSRYYLNPTHIEQYWHFALNSEIKLQLPSEFSKWKSEPFEHSKICPVIYKTNRGVHDPKIIPKVIQWETADLFS